MTTVEGVDRVVSVLRERGLLPADVAVVLGSGLGGFAARLQDPVAAPYGDLPPWPPAGVAGHEGRLIAGRLGGKRVLVLSGRAHLYEGHAPDVVTLPIRVIGRAGIPVLVLTNASGGINPDFGAGTLMVIDDHINLMGQNPLTGGHDDRWGDRFPDMTVVYSERLRRIAREAAGAADVAVAHGVYLAVSGPSFETPAEIRAFRVLGADAVGMSTVPEALVAHQMGLEVLGLSCIANAAAGILPAPLHADDVLAAAERAGPAFGDLLVEVIARL
ncbi:MAG TPA: purine-nucleoside phosphorylase [Vicinamibacterales bacterium]|nr:purine-nucleoside phosphorylase [Vicinamibacterales bacterium]